MSANKEDHFFVEYEIFQKLDGWILGRFVFIADGLIIGNYHDQSVDLQGCLYWLNEFLHEPVNRYEPDLFYMPKDQVFIRIGSSVLANEDENNFVSEVYEDTYRRFHISHLGMSSFDSTVLLLVQDENENSRLIWKDDSNILHDVICGKGEIERALKVAVESLKKDIVSAT